VRSVFHLLRHAEHGDLGKVLTGRGPGAPLSARGREQACLLAESLRPFSIGLLLTSPRDRARQTAEAIAERLGIRATVSSDLDEIDFGRWSGRSFADLEADPAWRSWNGQRDAAVTPAGDTMEAVALRIVGLMRGLVAREPECNAALVSHADVIKAACCRLLDLPFQAVHGMNVGPASRTSFAFEGGTAIPFAVGASCQLEAA
jgi:probable phosphoglycerate mutase